MCHRLIEHLKAYSPEFCVGQERDCELNETYFPELFKGNHTKGSFKLPKETRNRGKEIHRRCLSREQICIMTGISDTNATFFEMTGRGIVPRERAMEALRGRIDVGAVVTADKATVYVDVLCDQKVAQHESYDPKGRTEGTINRINTTHSLLDSFMKRFKSVSTEYLPPISIVFAGDAPSWRPIPAPLSSRAHGSSPTAPAIPASAIRSTSSRPSPIWTIGPHRRHSRLKWWHSGIRER